LHKNEFEGFSLKTLNIIYNKMTNKKQNKQKEKEEKCKVCGKAHKIQFGSSYNICSIACLLKLSKYLE